MYKNDATIFTETRFKASRGSLSNIVQKAVERVRARRIFHHEGPGNVRETPSFSKVSVTGRGDRDPGFLVVPIISNVPRALEFYSVTTWSSRDRPFSGRSTKLSFSLLRTRGRLREFEREEQREREREWANDARRFMNVSFNVTLWFLSVVCFFFFATTTATTKMEIFRVCVCVCGINFVVDREDYEWIFVGQWWEGKEKMQQIKIINEKNARRWNNKKSNFPV